MNRAENVMVSVRLVIRPIIIFRTSKKVLIRRGCVSDLFEKLRHTISSFLLSHGPHYISWVKNKLKDVKIKVWNDFERPKSQLGVSSGAI